MPDLAVVELDEAIRQLKETVVMSDDEHGLAFGFQLGQQLIVKNLFEVGVLVGSPLIENVDRAVFRIDGQKG